MHHRALVAGGVEGDVEFLGESRSDESNDKSSSNHVLTHFCLLGLKGRGAAR